MDTETLTEPTLTIPSGNGSRPALPETVRIGQAEQHRIPSPGTQRALKAETGRGWDEMVGPDAESADRIQTMIWIHLRREIPGLRWDECDDVSIDIEEDSTPPNPSLLSASATSPHSAGSGA